MEDQNSQVYARLDTSKIPELVGDGPKERFELCMRVLRETAWPLYLTGPSGSGKTLMAMNLAKQYGLESGVTPYYVQLSPEMTKTSLILGLRLHNGSLVVVDGIVARCMQAGGILVVDEAAHTTHELLLMFNSILDRTSVTSVGDKIIYAGATFRIIFCGNDSSYAGNVRLPQSFAQRMVSFLFDYPDFESELAISLRIAEDECGRPMKVPDSAARYIVATIRMIRSRQYPLSARNAAIILVLLNLGYTQAELPGDIDPYFTDPLTAEAKRRSAAVRILALAEDEVSAESLTDERVTGFQRFVSAVGITFFQTAFLSGCMYYLDVDGLEIDQESIRGDIENRVI
jgi:MoxR-like ATPase